MSTTDPDGTALSAEHSIRSWDVAARGETFRSAIHPTGADAEAYERSGAEQVDQLVPRLDDYLLSLRDGRKVGRVLEFGCGDGRVLRHWPAELWERWGCDSSAAMLQRLEEAARAEQRADAPSEVGYSYFVWDGMEPWATPAGRDLHPFDVVFAVTVLIHHSVIDGLRMARNMAQLVAPGGLLLLAHPVYEIGTDDGRWIGVTTWTVEQLQLLASDTGMQLVEYWESPGEFSFDRIGMHHGAVQVLRRPVTGPAGLPDLERTADLERGGVTIDDDGAVHGLITGPGPVPAGVLS